MGLYIINCVHGKELGRKCGLCLKTLGSYIDDTYRIIKIEKPWLGGP